MLCDFIVAYCGLEESKMTLHSSRKPPKQAKVQLSRDATFRGVVHAGREQMGLGTVPAIS